MSPRRPLQPPAGFPHVLPSIFTISVIASVAAGCRVYDPVTDRWTRRRDMPIATVNGVSAGYRGMLYVVTPCFSTRAIWPPASIAEIAGSAAGGTSRSRPRTGFSAPRYASRTSPAMDAVGRSS